METADASGRTWFERIASFSLLASRLCLLPLTLWPRDAVLLLASYWLVLTWNPPPRLRTILSLALGSWLLAVYGMSQIPWTLNALRGFP